MGNSPDDRFVHLEDLSQSRLLLLPDAFLELFLDLGGSFVGNVGVDLVLGVLADFGELKSQ